MDPVNRRHFLEAAGGLALAQSALAQGTSARPETSAAETAARPPVREPRATSGDRVEPNWAERLTVRVGPEKADIIGADDKAIQAAVDYVARLGGGTVQLLAGTYRLRNAIYLASDLRLAGAGADTVLIKERSTQCKLLVDSDWYDQEITVADPDAFRVGDGVCLRARGNNESPAVVLKRTLVARTGNRFKLDKPLRHNLWQMNDASAASLFPILSGEFIHNVVLENLTLDGNKVNNQNLDGNHAGCIFLQDCRDIVIRGVEARNYNGDGISWQICHDVLVENCHSHDHTGLGLHPGSGSQRPVIRGNRLERNNIGLFFCWGVKYGLAERNTIEDCVTGISIGHRDTDNLITENDVRRSGRVGVLFRPERGKSFAGHRNTLLRNRIHDSGGDNGIALDVQGGTEDLVLTRNELRESRAPAQRVGIRLGPDTENIRLDNNSIEGFATALDDRRRNK
jgi:hypothetical protein